MRGTRPTDAIWREAHPNRRQELKAFKRSFLLMYCECCSFSHQHSLRVASGGAQHPNNRLPDCRRATDRDANYDAIPIFVEACAHVASFDGLRGGDSGQRIERDPIRDRRFFNCARCLVGRRRRATNLLVISMVIPRSGRPPIACQRAFVRAPRDQVVLLGFCRFFYFVRACAQYSTLRTDFARFPPLQKMG